jgi:acyl-CoA synthetase (AMP-forming)/AMP-acid ligase II
MPRPSPRTNRTRRVLTRSATWQDVAERVSQRNIFSTGGQNAVPRVLTLGALDAEARRVAAALVELGVQPGERVCLHAPSSCCWLLSFFGAIHAGAVPCGLIFHGALEETMEQLERCSAAVVATSDPDFSEQLVASIQAGEALPLPPFLVLSGHAASLTPY